MHHYVTLFDSLFLPQGISLHTSMERHLVNFTLWILCVDDESYEIMEKLDLSNVRLLRLSSLENTELKRVKSTRSKKEYCWTLTPFAPIFVFESDPEIKSVTYLDADMWFNRYPIEIMDEFNTSGKSILITDHGYSPDNDHSRLFGRFCVQFLIFKKPACDSILRDWKDNCIEWCSDYPSEGKFGDQKYLDAWPKIFRSDVHILQKMELIMAPWNAKRFPWGQSEIWHFHGLRINPRANFGFKVLLGGYALPRVVVKYIYQPYLDDMRSAVNKLVSNGYWPQNQFKYTSKNLLIVFAGFLYRKLAAYQIINAKYRL